MVAIRTIVFEKKTFDGQSHAKIPFNFDRWVKQCSGKNNIDQPTKRNILKAASIRWRAEWTHSKKSSSRKPLSKSNASPNNEIFKLHLKIFDKITKNILTAHQQNLWLTSKRFSTRRMLSHAWTRRKVLLTEHASKKIISHFSNASNCYAKKTEIDQLLLFC